MSLTRDFEQTVVERLAHDLVNATVGFEELAAAIFGSLKDARQVRFDVRVVEAA